MYQFNFGKHFPIMYKKLFYKKVLLDINNVDSFGKITVKVNIENKV